MRARLTALRERMGPLWWNTALAFLASRVGDVINIYIGACLVPRVLSQDELGAVLPLMAMGAFFSTPLGILLIPVGKFLNVFHARGESGKLRAMLEDALLISALFTVVMAGYMLLTRDALLLRMQVSDKRLLWPILGFALLSCVDPVVGSATRAMKIFRPMLVGILVGPFLRLGGMLLLLAPLGALGYLLAQLGFSAWGTLLGLVAVFLVRRQMARRASYWGHWREMWAYTWPLIAMLVASRVAGPIEGLVIRHRLPTVDSAGYYYAVMFGNIPGYFTGAMAAFLWPLMSDRFERGESTRSLLVQSMLFNFAVGLLFVVLAALLMPWVFTLPGPWRPYGAYAGYVWQVALIGTLRTSLFVFTSHEGACRRFTYMRYLVPLMLLEAAVLTLLPAWPVARPYLPEALWAWVSARAQPSLQLFVGIILAANAAFVLGSLCQMVLRRGRAGGGAGGGPGAGKTT